MMRSNDAECPICLDGMSEADVAYPLLCPTECGYNFCLSCVKHLVESSQDDYQMASDGNRHVKVHLLCPQCRGDLENTISDTLMLRKAKNAEKYRDIADSELNATELRAKHEFVKLYAKEVEHAEARLRKFHMDHGSSHEIPAPLDLDNGAQESYSGNEKRLIDSTLFQGLHYAMSQDEQEYVQQLLTSGNAEDLANAAQILNGILQLTRQGLKPRNIPVRSKSEDRKQLEILDLFRKKYPLPARLPKYFVLNTFPLKRRIILFEDDEWDGSIADAFTRVHTLRDKNSCGIDNILSGAELAQLPAKARVRVSSVRGQAGQVGLQKGDIVTHLNGEQFHGSAGELKELITNWYEEDPSSTFQIVVNADDSTAEILRLRALKCNKTMADVARL